jgi:hypothetical protein
MELCLIIVLFRCTEVMFSSCLVGGSEFRYVMSNKELTELDGVDELCYVLGRNQARYVRDEYIPLRQVMRP